MGLVLWIDQNTFATGLFEKVFKQKGLPFYTVSSADDFAHLITDLQPDVIVVDAQTALNSLEKFKSQYEASHKFEGRPVIVLDPLAGLEFIENKIGEIGRPIGPFELPDRLKKIFSL